EAKKYGGDQTIRFPTSRREVDELLVKDILARDATIAQLKKSLEEERRTNKGVSTFRNVIGDRGGNSSSSAPPPTNNPQQQQQQHANNGGHRFQNQQHQQQQQNSYLHNRANGGGN